MSPNAAHPGSSGTRELVKKEFSTSGSEYDAIRFERPRFRLLSECYARIFLKLLPEPAGVNDVLEIGAGTGRFTALVLERGFSVTATDINQGYSKPCGTRSRKWAHQTADGSRSRTC